MRLSSTRRHRVCRDSSLVVAPKRSTLPVRQRPSINYAVPGALQNMGGARLCTLRRNQRTTNHRQFNAMIKKKSGGRDKDRTGDALLAKQGKTLKALSGVLHQNAAIDSATATNR